MNDIHLPGWKNKKRIVIISIIAVFLLIAISFSTALSTNSNTEENKETPLFKIRIRRVIGEKLEKIGEYIKTKFIGARLFFLPFQWIKNQIFENELVTDQPRCTYDSTPTCKQYYTCFHPPNRNW